MFPLSTDFIFLQLYHLFYSTFIVGMVFCIL